MKVLFDDLLFERNVFGKLLMAEHRIATRQSVFTPSRMVHFKTSTLHLCQKP